MELTADPSDPDPVSALANEERHPGELPGEPGAGLLTGPPTTGERPEPALSPGSGAAPPGHAGFASDVAISTTLNVGLILVNTATGLMAARLLGPTGRGELAAIMNWQVFGAMLATLGLPDAVIYFTARTARRASRQLATGAAVAFAASLVVTAVGWVLLPTLLASQSHAVVTTARWYLLSLPLEALWNFPDRSLRGQGDFLRWNLVRPLGQLLWLSALIFAATTGHAVAAWVAYSYLVGRAALLVPLFVYVRTRLPGRLRPERELVRPMVRYGLPGLITTIPSTLNNRLDQLMMAGFLPARTLGLYAIAVSWSALTNPLALAFSNVLFPRLAATDDPAARARAFARGSRLGLVVSGVVSAAFVPLTPFVLPLLFGAQFRPAVDGAMVLVAASVFTGWNWVLEEGLRGLGRPASVLWGELTGLAVTVVMLVTMLRSFGLMGAALASLGGYATVTVALLVEGRRHTRLPLRELVIPTTSDLRLLWDEGRGLAASVLRRVLRRGGDAPGGS